jgi:hypothetical protein
MSQPGHNEQLIGLFLDERSVYFPSHVIAVLGAVVTLAALAASFRASADAAVRTLRLLLVAHVLAFGAYLWPLLKHGTNATVWAATIEILFFVSAAIVTGWGKLRHFATLTTGAICAAAVVLLLHNVEVLSFPRFPQFQAKSVYWQTRKWAEIGTAVRSFDEYLNTLWPRYIVVDNPAFYPNDHVLYWEHRMSELFTHTVAGLGLQTDSRWKGTLQHERHPRYRFWESAEVTDVSDRCNAGPGRSCFALPFAFGQRYANVRPAPMPAAEGFAWIEPVAAELGEVLLKPPAAGWSIVPLRDEDIARLGDIRTAALAERNYRPFLACVVGYHATFYLLWLPRAK